MIIGAAFCPHPPLIVPEVAVGAAPELDDLRAACQAAIRDVMAVSPDRIALVGPGPVTAELGEDAVGTLSGYGVDLRIELPLARMGQVGIELPVTRIGQVGTELPVTRMGQVGTELPVTRTGQVGIELPVTRIGQVGTELPVTRTGRGATEWPGARGEQTGTEATLPLSLTIGEWLLECAGWQGPVTTLALAADADIQTLQHHAAQLADPAERIGLLVMADASSTRTEKAPGSWQPGALAFDAGISAALASGEPARLGGVDLAAAQEVGAHGWPAWRVAALATAATSWRAHLFYDDAPYGVGYLVASWT